MILSCQKPSLLRANHIPSLSHAGKDQMCLAERTKHFLRSVFCKIAEIARILRLSYDVKCLPKQQLKANCLYNQLLTFKIV